MGSKDNHRNRQYNPSKILVIYHPKQYRKYKPQNDDKLIKPPSYIIRMKLLQSHEVFQ